jgi:hypothetical protein
MTMVVIGYDRYNVIVKGFTGTKIGPGLVSLLQHVELCKISSSSTSVKYKTTTFICSIVVIGYDIYNVIVKGFTGTKIGPGLVSELQLFEI